MIIRRMPARQITTSGRDPLLAGWIKGSRQEAEAQADARRQTQNRPT